DGQEHDRDSRGRLPREWGERSGERGQDRGEQADGGRDGPEAVQGSSPSSEYVMCRRRAARTSPCQGAVPGAVAWEARKHWAERRGAVSERPRGPLPALEDA